MPDCLCVRRDRHRRRSRPRPSPFALRLSSSSWKGLHSTTLSSRQYIHTFSLAYLAQVFSHLLSYVVELSAFLRKVCSDSRSTQMVLRGNVCGGGGQRTSHPSRRLRLSSVGRSIFATRVSVGSCAAQKPPQQAIINGVVATSPLLSEIRFAPVCHNVCAVLLCRGQSGERDQAHAIGQMFHSFN